MKTAEELKPREQSALTASAPGMPAPSLRALVDRLMVWMPGLSDTEARMAVSERAREFCSRTNCWSVPLSLGPCAPFGAWPVTCVPEGAAALRVRCGRDLGAWAQCRWSGLPGPHPFVFPWPGVPDPLAFLHEWCRNFARPRVVLAPGIGSETVPDGFVARWGDAVCDGARAHLCAMTGRLWSDPSGAALYGRKYDAAVGEARAAFELGGVPSYLQTRSTVPFVI